MNTPHSNSTDQPHETYESTQAADAIAPLDSDNIIAAYAGRLDGDVQQRFVDAVSNVDKVRNGISHQVHNEATSEVIARLDENYKIAGQAHERFGYEVERAFTIPHRVEAPLPSDVGKKTADKYAPFLADMQEEPGLRAALEFTGLGGSSYLGKTIAERVQSHYERITLDTTQLARNDGKELLDKQRETADVSDERPLIENVKTAAEETATADFDEGLSELLETLNATLDTRVSRVLGRMAMPSKNVHTSKSARRDAISAQVTKVKQYVEGKAAATASKKAVRTALNEQIPLFDHNKLDSEYQAIIDTRLAEAGNKVTPEAMDQFVESVIIPELEKKGVLHVPHEQRYTQVRPDQTEFSPDVQRLIDEEIEALRSQGMTKKEILRTLSMKYHPDVNNDTRDNSENEEKIRYLLTALRESTTSSH